jgi:hypothetical protein
MGVPAPAAQAKATIQRLLLILVAIDVSFRKDR